MPKNPSGTGPKSLQGTEKPSIWHLFQAKNTSHVKALDIKTPRKVLIQLIWQNSIAQKLSASFPYCTKMLTVSAIEGEVLSLTQVETVMQEKKVNT